MSWKLGCVPTLSASLNGDRIAQAAILAAPPDHAFPRPWLRRKTLAFSDGSKAQSLDVGWLPGPRLAVAHLKTVGLLDQSHIPPFVESIGRDEAPFRKNAYETLEVTRVFGVCEMSSSHRHRAPNILQSRGVLPYNLAQDTCIKMSGQSFGIAAIPSSFRDHKSPVPARLVTDQNCGSEESPGNQVYCPSRAYGPPAVCIHGRFRKCTEGSRGDPDCPLLIAGSA